MVTRACAKCNSSGSALARIGSGSDRALFTSSSSVRLALLLDGLTPLLAFKTRNAPSARLPSKDPRRKPAGRMLSYYPPGGGV
jgi:hypothetical protein